MLEFCWYHANGDCAVNAIVLWKIADTMRLGIEQRVDLAYMYSITYCVASSVYLFSNVESLTNTAFVSFAKQSIHFTSDRKYVKMGDRFEKLIEQFITVIKNKERRLIGKITENGKIDTQKALNLCSRLYYFSRYSSFLFVETLACLLNIELTVPKDVNFGNDRMRFAAGIFNVFELDNAADIVERTRKLPYSRSQVQEMLDEIQRNVERTGGNPSVVDIETTLCAYRKHFKGTRYNGYYADRMLHEINAMKVNSPEFAKICEMVLQARKATIPEVYLGEINGWSGIRSDLKNEYRKHARIIGCPY